MNSIGTSYLMHINMRKMNHINSFSFKTQAFINMHNVWKSWKHIKTNESKNNDKSYGSH